MNREMKATYDPADNKLRLRTTERLDAETYAEARELGFIWAAKQGLFVAPAWSPAREDFLISLCEEIGDEDTSLAGRAEERAERFEGYKENRITDAEAAEKGVSGIADNIPLGQPILVGHHGERHARKDAERITRGMEKAVNMWDTANYWQDRAAGALRNAKYKELPGVRARRIKGLEAEKRKIEREKADSEKLLKAYQTTQHAHLQDCLLKSWGTGLTREEQIRYEKGEITKELAVELAISNLTESIASRNRWIRHIENRLVYEKEMLGEQGKLSLLDKKPIPKQLPLCNYRAPEGIRTENQYHKGVYSIYSQKEMTKAEYAKIFPDYKGTREIENSHRVRIAIIRGDGKMATYCIYLTDSKEHKKPDAVELIPNPVPAKQESHDELVPYSERLGGDAVDSMRDALKAGVKVVVTPQLFPTPKELAEMVIAFADIQPGMSVLEPSAGTGNLLKVMPNIRPGGYVVAVEINSLLVKNLEEEADEIVNVDFLTWRGPEFDRIIMNPPFERGSDIKHINHALTMLKTGGRLVAICANGIRQQEAFRGIATHWEDLPDGSFLEQGTNVRTAIVIIDKSSARG